MATEKKFLAKSMNDFLIKKYLEAELRNAGVSSIVIQKTPLATRIAIRVKKPSLVIGKKGATIKSITERLEKEFKIDNPQLDIIEVENPVLDAKLVAEKIARQIEIEGNIKQIMRMTLQDVMEAGAIGSEIIVSGKVVGKGGKAKALRMRSGYLKKSGHIMRLVDEGRSTAYLKAGAIGVTAKIVQPGTVFPDQVDLEEYTKLAVGAQEGAAANGLEAAASPEQAAAEKAEAEEAERRMNEKIEAAKREAKARALERKKKAVKKKPEREAENLIKSAEAPAPQAQAAPAPEKKE